MTAKKALLTVFMWMLAVAPAHAVTDTYEQTFDSMQDGMTVNGADSWVVVTGDEEKALVESGDTASGSGKALKIVGTQITPDVARAADYGNLSPTWVEYVVKPSMGSDTREVPSTGIAAVNFSSTGNVMASDGENWVDTGKNFDSDTWYRVLLKLDFSTHLYDVYVEPASAPKAVFVPEKENLNFIDPSLSSLGQVGFMGAYNMDSQADARVDEVVVHYIDKLQFITSPHTLVKGHASGLITVQLQSANSDPQTAWRDISLELQSSAQTGEFSLDDDDWVPVTSLVLPEGAQQTSFYYKGFQEGKPTISVSEFPDRGWTDATQEENVVEEGEFFRVTLGPQQTAGEPFVLQITAMDGAGGADTSYSGAVELFVQYVSPTTGTKGITPSETSGFVLGLKDTVVAYPDAGVVKIGVRDQADTMKVGYSGDILFLPHSFDVSAEPLQIVGKNFPVTVKALEKEGHVAPNYRGPAQLEPVAMIPGSTSGGVFNPAELPDGLFESGVATLATAYNRWGLIGLKVSDSTHPEKNSTSDPVKFVPKSISVTVKPPSASRNFFYTGESMEITVSVHGEDELPIENFQGTVSLTPMPAFNIPAQYAFVEADKGQKKFVATASGPGEYTLSVEDVENALSAESEEFEVKDATIVVSSTSSPVGATAVEIQLVDSQGRRIKEESDMTILILFEEENANGSVFFSDINKPILFKKGVARVVIADSEAETVTISARSKYGLKVVNGKVTFGRAGATGVGALMLRESKD